MDFSKLPDPPENITASNILLRIIDSVAFRYYWSLHEIQQDFLHFQPAQNAKTAFALLKHIYQLTARVYEGFSGKIENFDDAWQLREIRDNNLMLFSAIREFLINSNEDDLGKGEIYHKRSGKKLTFWYILNGPLTDMLTHIGQINSWRRMAGYPPPKMDMIGGKPVE